MLYLHTRRNRQARNSTSWGEVACLQVAALEPTCQDGGQKIGRKASEDMISLKNKSSKWNNNKKNIHRNNSENVLVYGMYKLYGPDHLLSLLTC